MIRELRKRKLSLISTVLDEFVVGNKELFDYQGSSVEFMEMLQEQLSMIHVSDVVRELKNIDPYVTPEEVGLSVTLHKQAKIVLDLIYLDQNNNTVMLTDGSRN